METKINLQGIFRNASKVNSPIGACHELINLRKKYDSWRPILPKTVISEGFPTSEELFIHTIDGENTEYYISYDADGTINAYDVDGDLVQLLLTLTASPNPTVKFTSLNNFLIITDETNFNKYIFRCDPNAATIYINTSDIPYINMRVISEDQGLTPYYDAKYDNDSFQAAWMLLESGIREEYPDYFEGYVFLKWAIELVDGSTLKHSPPIFIYNGHMQVDTDEVDFIRIYAFFYRLKYTLSASLPSGWANYKNLIRGISIFMTKPISKWDLEKSGVTEENVWLGMVEKNITLTDMFRDESIYYRVHHIPYNKIRGSLTGYVGVEKTFITRDRRTMINGGPKVYNNSSRVARGTTGTTRPKRSRE